MAQPAADAALDAFARALAALQKRDWKEAESELTFVFERSDRPELRDRARQYLNTCRARAADEFATKQEAPVDPYLVAVVAKNQGDLSRALDICRQEGREQKDERFAYLAASIHALEARADEAARVLARAIELNPTNKVHAFHDPDFAELRHDRDFQQLFGLA